MRYLVITRWISLAQLQPVQRRFPSRGRAVPAMRFQFSHKRRQYRIMPPFVMVVQILIAQRYPKYTLLDQRQNIMFDKTLVPAIRKTLRQAAASGASPDPPVRAATPRHRT